MYRTLPHICLTFILSLPLCAWSQLKGENLLQNLPPAYKVGFQSKKENLLMMEMIPEDEAIEQWSEMLTTQIFLGMKKVTPEGFQSFMQQQWQAACKGSQAAAVTKGVENGYPFAVWFLSCPLNRATGKPEFTWFKAIKGNDSFYLVQKAFKFEPSKEQIARWMQYLRHVSVCDTRLDKHPCPTRNPSGK